MNEQPNRIKGRRNGSGWQQSASTLQEASLSSEQTGDLVGAVVDGSSVGEIVGNIVVGDIDGN